MEFENIKSILKLSDENVYKHKLDYYWFKGLKYIHFHNEPISHQTLDTILGNIIEDGDKYPFNSCYLIVVIAKTTEDFSNNPLIYADWSQQGLFKFRESNVVFILYNEELKKLYYPEEDTIFFRYSFSKIVKLIKKTI